METARCQKEKRTESVQEKRERTGEGKTLKRFRGQAGRLKRRNQRGHSWGSGRKWLLTHTLVSSSQEFDSCSRTQTKESMWTQRAGLRNRFRPTLHPSKRWCPWAGPLACLACSRWSIGSLPTSCMSIRSLLWKGGALRGQPRGRTASSHWSRSAHKNQTSSASISLPQHRSLASFRKDSSYWSVMEFNSSCIKLNQTGGA